MSLSLSLQHTKLCEDTWNLIIYEKVDNIHVTGGRVDGSGNGYGEAGRKQLVVTNGGIKGIQKELTNEEVMKMQMDEELPIVV